METWTETAVDEFTRQVGPLRLRVYWAAATDFDEASWAFEVFEGEDPRSFHGSDARGLDEAQAEAVECALGWAVENDRHDLVRVLSDELPRRAA